MLVSNFSGYICAYQMPFIPYLCVFLFRFHDIYLVFVLLSEEVYSLLELWDLQSIPWSCPHISSAGSTSGNCAKYPCSHCCLAGTLYVDNRLQSVCKAQSLLWYIVPAVILHNAVKIFVTSQIVDPGRHWMPLKQDKDKWTEDPNFYTSAQVRHSCIRGRQMHTADITRCPRHCLLRIMCMWWNVTRKKTHAGFVSESKGKI